MRVPIAGLVSLVLLSIAAPSLVCAADKRKAGAASTIRPLSETLSGKARQAYDAGKLLFEAGDFAGALVKFKNAFELQGDPRLLWNMAAAEKSQRHYTRVRTLAKEYVEKADAAGLLTAQDRQDARSLLETLRALTASVHFNVTPEGTQIQVDDDKLGESPLPAPVDVDMGRRTFTFTKPGFRPQSLVREVAGGSQVSIEASLEATSATLTIKADVPGATITLDGRAVGVGSWHGTTSPGHRFVKVAASGYRLYQMDITLDDRDAREFTVHLEREAGSGRLYWALGAAAVVAAGAVGGYLLSRPREAAIVDGTIATVQLPLQVAR